MRNICLGLLICSCLTMIYGITGYGISPSGCLDTQNPSLSLIAPNNGETWFAGGIGNILWYAGDENLVNNSVCLGYSIDGGVTFQSIAEGVPNAFDYAWMIPQTLSNNASIRISVNDSFGNQTMDESCVPFLIKNGLKIPLGLSIIVVNGEDVLLNWQAVTQYVNGTPATPEGYIILCSSDPYCNDADLTVLGNTSSLSFTHFQALLENENRFYSVKAYLGTDNRIFGIFNDWKMDNDNVLKQTTQKEHLYQFMDNWK